MTSPKSLLAKRKITPKLKRFYALSSAKAKVEIALLEACGIIYTERFANKLVMRKDWARVALKDLEEMTQMAYLEAK